MTSLDKLQSIETDIREGRFTPARSALRAFGADTLHRRDLTQFAELARRAGLPELAIRLLHRHVRPEGRSRGTQATLEEKAEYAGSLIRIGATEEARELLVSCDSAQLPKILLFQAFTHIHQWDYAEAVPILLKLENHPRISPYERRIARVNLAASYVLTERFDEAETLLQELLSETRLEKNTLLHGNCLELSAQAAVFAGNYARANRLLGEAETLLASSAAGSTDVFYIQKWRTVMSALKDTARAGELQKLRVLAVKRGDFETARDSDFYLSFATRDHRRLVHLYFGTPYPAYRRRIEVKALESEMKSIGTEAQVGWRFGDAVRAGWVLDLVEARLGEHALKHGQVLHRLLIALTSDLYKAKRLSELHAAVFPGRHFHPEFSPDLVHQALKRLRVLFGETRAPVQLQEFFGRFSIMPLTSGCAIRMRATQPSKEDVLLGRILKEFGTKPFSAEVLSCVLATSKRSTHQLLNELLKRGRVSRTGGGRMTQWQASQNISAE